jgi:hypothetical protein
MPVKENRIAVLTITFPHCSDLRSQLKSHHSRIELLIAHFHTKNLRLLSHITRHKRVCKEIPLPVVSYKPTGQIQFFCPELICHNELRVLGLARYPQKDVPGVHEPLLVIVLKFYINQGKNAFVYFRFSVIFYSCCDLFRRSCSSVRRMANFNRKRRQK